MRRAVAWHFCRHDQLPGAHSTSCSLHQFLQALAVAELSRTQAPTQAADAAGHADALALLRSLRLQLSGSAEMAGKLNVLEQALQQVRRQHETQGCAVYLCRGCPRCGCQHAAAVCHSKA
jgi:hypothetical protein